MEERIAGSSFNRGGRHWFAPTLILLPPALLTTLAGIYGLYLDAVDETSQLCRVTAGVLLLLSGIVQLLIVRKIDPSVNANRLHLRGSSHGVRRGISSQGQSRPALAGWFVAGVIGCYLGALAIGPKPGIVWLLTAVVTIWYATMIWYAMVPGRTAAVLRDLGQCRIARLAIRATCLLMITLLGTEVGLRIYCLAHSDRLTARFVVQRMAPPPGSEVFGHTVNSQGFTGDDFQIARRPGVCRIAVLGDELAVSGCQQSNCLRMLDDRLPGAEIYNFGMPEAGPLEYAAVFVDRVVQYKPDLILCFISVGDDVSGAAAMPGYFEWRNLQLGQLADCAYGSYCAYGSRLNCESYTNCRSLLPESQADYLQQRGRQLTVCQTPMTSEMCCRWEELQTHMESLANQCRIHNMPLGIVVIPGDFQTNEVLLSTLQRRVGYATDAIDVELPQRRLLLMSQQYKLSALDLLPVLRESGASVYCHNQNQLSRRGNALVADSLQIWLERCYGTQIAGLSERSTLMTAEVAVDTMLR